MKHCPKCSRTYPDDMRFCLTDGGELISDAPTVDLGKTIAWVPPKDVPRQPPAAPAQPQSPPSQPVTPPAPSRPVVQPPSQPAPSQPVVQPPSQPAPSQPVVQQPIQQPPPSVPSQPAPPPSQPAPPSQPPALPSHPVVVAPVATAPPTRKTSKVAKASLILSIISLLLTLVLGPLGTIGRMAFHFYRLITRLRFAPELLGLFVLVILPLISILLAIIGLFLAFRRPKKFGGKISAPVGIVLSLLSIVIFAAFFFYTMSRFF